MRWFDRATEEQDALSSKPKAQCSFSGTHRAGSAATVTVRTFILFFSLAF
jgi:hypothetical protein